MPKNVRRFEFLIYLAGAIEILTYPLQGISTAFAASAISVAWWGFIILLIWLTARRRKNWARWVLFCLFVLETVLVLGSLLGIRAAIYGQGAPFAMPIQLLVLMIEACAYYFVFTGDSRNWFRKAGAVAS